MGEDLWVIRVKDGKVLGGNDMHSRLGKVAYVAIFVVPFVALSAVAWAVFS